MSLLSCKILPVLLCSCGMVSVACADGLSDLEAFLKQVQQGRTHFTQTVTTPKREGQAMPRSKTSSGEFEFLRPNRFRFHYEKPFEQTIVADGQTLWLYDVDLNQVTARRQQEALGNTPAAVVTSAVDLKSLSRSFTLANAPDAEGQQWVSAIPKASDGQLQVLRLGFKQGQLTTLDMLDSFGQRSVLQFTPFDTRTAFHATHFNFQPPAGVDVVRP